MTGREKCELLKMIRKNIAEMNNIVYSPKTCDHKGDCSGYCNQCDAEAKYLMEKLKMKEAKGLPINIDTQCFSELETLMADSAEESDEDEHILMGDVIDYGPDQ